MAESQKSTARKTLIAAGLLFVTGFLFLPGSIDAETVFLRSGQYVTGELTAQTRDTVTIRTSSGEKVIPKTKIRRILYTTTTEEDKKKLEEQAKAEDAKREAEQRERDRVENARRQEEAQARARAEEARKREEADAKKKAAEAGFFSGPVFAGAWRSAVIPGWGQYHQGRMPRAKIYAGAALGTFILTFYYYQDYSKKRRTYSSEADTLLAITVGAPDSVFAPAAAYGYAQTLNARKAMEESGTRTNLLFTGLALFWIWNVADAVIFRPSENTAVFVQPARELNFGLLARF